MLRKNLAPTNSAKASTVPITADKSKAVDTEGNCSLILALLRTCLSSEFFNWKPASAEMYQHKSAKRTCSQLPVN